MEQQENHSGKKRPYYHHRNRKPGDSPAKRSADKPADTSQAAKAPVPKSAESAPLTPSNTSQANNSTSQPGNGNRSGNGNGNGNGYSNRNRQNRNRGNRRPDAPRQEASPNADQTITQPESTARETRETNSRPRTRGANNTGNRKREETKPLREKNTSPAPAAPVSPVFPGKEAVFENTDIPLDMTLDLTDILPPIALEAHPDTPKKPSAPAPEADGNTQTGEAPAPTVEVVGVRFNKTGKMYYFAPGDAKVQKGDFVIVDTARGMEYGEVCLGNTQVPESKTVPPLRPMLRVATPQDIVHHADNQRREADAFRICLEKIAAHGLDMKLVAAQYTFDNSKLLFYFTSAGRVDFRELVKDLASVFRTRIELRQIGIRDEAKLMGGLGICGRPLCCASYLGDFAQVSIKMAKEQNLSLNSNKISGTCGRLMCCLNYEYGVYCEEAAHCPAPGSYVSTPEGNGFVTEVNVLAGQVKVSLSDAAPGTVPKFYQKDLIRVLSEPKKTDTNSQDEDSESDFVPGN